MNRDNSPLPRLAGNLHVCGDAGGPFSEAAKAKVARRGNSVCGRLKAGAIVSDCGDNTLPVSRQPDGDRGCVGMMGGIVDRLAEHPQQLIGRFGRQQRKRSSNFERQRGGNQFPQFRKQRPHPVGEAALQPGRLAEIPDILPGLVLQPGQDLSLSLHRAAGVGVGNRRRGRIDAKCEAGQVLLKRVVKLPGNPLPLSRHGFLLDLSLNQAQLPADLPPQQHHPGQGNTPHGQTRRQRHRQSAGRPPGRARYQHHIVH